MTLGIATFLGTNSAVASSIRKGVTYAHAAKIAHVGAGTAVLIVTAATKLLGAGINGMAICIRMNSMPSTTTGPATHTETIPPTFETY